MVLIVMGVAGAGKTTVGRALAEKLSCHFFDADDFHSPENKARMRAGIPLTDADRAPWLAALNLAILEWQAANTCTVLACSALKRSYRAILTRGVAKQDLRFIFLNISPEVAAERLRSRLGHYASEALMPSQFEALEPPDASEALIVDASQPIPELVSQITTALNF